MKKIFFLLSVFLGIIMISCNQDPVFFSISQEVEPKNPRIRGSPTNIIKFQNIVFSTGRFNRDIHYYNSEGRWNTFPSPGGQIIEIAATENSFYVLAGNIGSTEIYKTVGIVEAMANNWSEINNNSGHNNIQTIYGAGNILFAGAINSSGKSIILYEKNGELVELITETGFLTGVAFKGNYYYIATAGSGIYLFDGNSVPSQIPIPESLLNVTGIISLETQVVAVTRNGRILYGSGDSFEPRDQGITFTGALGLWKRGDVQLLLLGVQGGNASHGYREIVLQNGNLNTNDLGLRIPGSDVNISSVTNQDKYNASIRRNPIRAILQAPDGMLFAATIKNGLWSYRNDEWNFEE